MSAKYAGLTIIEYLLDESLVEVLFTSVHITLLVALQDLYRLRIQTICSPVL